eukprot:scaffold7522_cov202-Skeletonema_marinoi.AAC.12
MKLRAAIASAIAEMEPSRDGNPYECFLKIRNEEGALSYQMVRDYMAEKSNEVEVDRNCAIKYLNAINDGSESNITDDMDAGNGKLRVIVYQSESAYNGIRSAVVWVYKLARVEMPFANNVGIYINGLKRNIAAAKQHLQAIAATINKRKTPEKMNEGGTDDEAPTKQPRTTTPTSSHPAMPSPNSTTSPFGTNTPPDAILPEAVNFDVERDEYSGDCNVTKEQLFEYGRDEAEAKYEICRMCEEAQVSGGHASS